MTTYMKFTLLPYYTELVDAEEQLSLTEKQIMSSYDICSSLDPTKNVPNTKDLPISKVAILLVDSKKENCFLNFDSFAHGSWSLIEKDVDTSDQILEVTSNINNIYMNIM